MRSLIKSSLHDHLATFAPGYTFGELVGTMDEQIAENGMQGITVMSHVKNDRRDEDMEERAKQEGYNVVSLDNGFSIEHGGKIFPQSVEVPTAEGHILLVGARKGIYIPEGRTIKDSIDQACQFSGYQPSVIGVHTHGWGGVGPYLEKHLEDLRLFDAIETHNGSTAFPVINKHLTASGANRDALRFYEERCKAYGLGAIISTDGHSREELFTSYSLLPTPDLRSAEAFASSLREGIRGSRGLGRRENSYKGTLDHAIKIAALIAVGKAKSVARKLRLAA